MADASRLSRAASIAISLFFAYVICATTLLPAVIGLVAGSIDRLPVLSAETTIGTAIIILLSWPTKLPPTFISLLYAAVAVSLLLGSRVYAVRPGRLTTFARFALGLPLLAAAAVMFIVTAEPYGFYLLFYTFPLFLWIGLIALPAWLIAISRDPRSDE